jgi:shikimate kinase
MDERLCITLIGMAGVGKTTIGKALARALDYPHLDTDHIIEAWYGRPLEEISRALGKEGFIALEEELICEMRAAHLVISTGGSVVYGKKAVERLRGFGPLVLLSADPDIIMERVAAAPDRGLAKYGHQSIADLIVERSPLYKAAADVVIDTGEKSPGTVVEEIQIWLDKHYEKKHSAP